jgi:DNA helicase HerA-like ATPase
MSLTMSLNEAASSAELLHDDPVIELLRHKEPREGFSDRGAAPFEGAAAPALSLDAGALLGHVTSVDAGRIVVTLADEEAVAQASVSALVALRAGDGFLMAIIDRLACSETSERVMAHLMPVGAFHPSAGGGTFRVGAAHQPRIRAGCYLVDGDVLRRFVACIAKDVLPEERLILGHYGDDDGAEAVADGNRMFQRHLAILGNSGAGKSWAVALLLERAARLQNASLIVLDLHGEYGPLAEGGIATRLRLGGPADLVGEGDDLLYLPYWIFEIDELAMLVLNDDDPHAADQRLWLIQRIEAMKRASLAAGGNYEAMAAATVDSPVPYRLDQLIEWAERDEVEQIVLQPSGKVVPGPYTGKLRSLINRLQARCADPRFAFVFQPPEESKNLDWLPQMALMLLQSGDGRPGIKAIDLSELPTALVPLVAGLLARLVYDVQFWMEPGKRTPLCLVCDEAHVYLREAEDVSPIYRSAMRRFETIAKEGRKYGVCLAVVSQRPSELNRTVLSQCNNFVILRLSNDHDHEAIVELVPGAFAGVADVLPTLDVGEAVVVGDAIPLPVRIRLDRATHGPDSRTIPYWSLWASQPCSTDAIVMGVAALRAQSRTHAEAMTAAHRVPTPAPPPVRKEPPVAALTEDPLAGDTEPEAGFAPSDEAQPSRPPHPLVPGFILPSRRQANGL